MLSGGQGSSFSCCSCPLRSPFSFFKTSHFPTAGPYPFKKKKKTVCAAHAHWRLGEDSSIQHVWGGSFSSELTRRGGTQSLLPIREGLVNKGYARLRHCPLHTLGCVRMGWGGLLG